MQIRHLKRLEVRLGRQGTTYGTELSDLHVMVINAGDVGSFCPFVGISVSFTKFSKRENLSVKGLKQTYPNPSRRQ